jgi:hypothetical protein
MSVINFRAVTALRSVPACHDVSCLLSISVQSLRYATFPPAIIILIVILLLWTFSLDKILTVIIPLPFQGDGFMIFYPPRCGGLLCNVLSGRSIF